MLVPGCSDGASASSGRDASGDRDSAIDPDAGPSLDDADIDVDAGELADVGTPETSCPVEPACDAPLPDLGGTASWRHSVATPIVTAMGSARHRGRDLYLREGDEQWALAKFAYGPFDDDLKDEDVDIYLLRGCGSAWEHLGTVATTNDADHATVEGVEDTGGRVYFQIPSTAALGIGRHRLAFVVRGDHSIAEQFIEVLPATARFVVTDVDGTQTESETAEWATLVGASGPDARPYGADVLTAYAARGYRIFYLTARPDWLHTRTHEWLAEYGYPPGNVHTTLTATGALGTAAHTFKYDELVALLARFPGAIELAIGNTDTDASAYQAVGTAPEDAVFYQFDAGGAGTRVDDYSTLLPGAESSALACPF